MKYLSIDVETTGLNVETCQILSIGVVVEDTNNLKPLESLPRFHCAVLHNEIKGEPFALNLNKELLSKIVEYQTAKDKLPVQQKHSMFFREEKYVVEALREFLIAHKFIEDTEGVNHITVAGKNFATFDKFFVERLPRWKQYFKIRQRIIDPTVLFTDWGNDESLPNLQTCKERAGIKDITVSHNADEDALDIIKILRKHYG